MSAPAETSSDLIGRDPDRLSIAESRAAAGKWIALEIYTPQTLPLRRIVAIGDSVDSCAADLRRRGLDPLKFEFTILRPAC